MLAIGISAIPVIMVLVIIAKMIILAIIVMIVILVIIIVTKVIKNSNSKNRSDNGSASSSVPRFCQCRGLAKIGSSVDVERPAVRDASLRQRLLLTNTILGVPLRVPFKGVYEDYYKGDDGGLV